MNNEETKTATRQWAKNNGDAIDTACSLLALFIHSGITSATPFNYFALFVTCVMGEKDQDAQARLVLQTLEEVNAAREIVSRAWNAESSSESGLLFDAAARIDPTIDTAALKELWRQQRTKTTHTERKARGLI